PSSIRLAGSGVGAPTVPVSVKSGPVPKSNVTAVMVVPGANVPVFVKVTGPSRYGTCWELPRPSAPVRGGFTVPSGLKVPHPPADKPSVEPERLSVQPKKVVLSVTVPGVWVHVVDTPFPVQVAVPAAVAPVRVGPDDGALEKVNTTPVNTFPKASSGLNKSV